jgi:hypothetical protein
MYASIYIIYIYSYIYICIVLCCFDNPECNLSWNQTNSKLKSGQTLFSLLVRSNLWMLVDFRTVLNFLTCRYMIGIWYAISNIIVIYRWSIKSQKFPMNFPSLVPGRQPCAKRTDGTSRSSNGVTTAEGPGEPGGADGSIIHRSADPSIFIRFGDIVWYCMIILIHMLIYYVWCTN